LACCHVACTSPWAVRSQMGVSARRGIQSSPLTQNVSMVRTYPLVALVPMGSDSNAGWGSGNGSRGCQTPIMHGRPHTSLSHAIPRR